MSSCSSRAEAARGSAATRRVTKMLRMGCLSKRNGTPAGPVRRDGARRSLAERLVPHRRQDAVDDELLELRLARERRPVGEGVAVVAQRGEPRAAAVIVLAPG